MQSDVIQFIINKVEDQLIVSKPNKSIDWNNVKCFLKDNLLAIICLIAAIIFLLYRHIAKQHNLEQIEDALDLEVLLAKNLQTNND